MIKLQNISYAYKGQGMAVENVSAHFEKGRVTTILGPNGCGKSTLLKLINGLLTPTSGEIFLDGENAASVKTKARAKKMALLAQTHQPPDIPVEELVAYGRYPHLKFGQSPTAADRALVDSALSQVHAQEFRTRRLTSLSGGQRQRAYIAMALAQDTPLILLDEPTTYLDVSIRYDIMDLVKQLNQKGKTIIMVLHDLELALEYSDTILLMKKGRIQTQGSPEDVIRTGLLDTVFKVHTLTFQKDGRTYYHFAKSV